MARYVEPACKEALRELERRGYPVLRVRGFFAIDQGPSQMASEALAHGFQGTLWIDADVVSVSMILRNESSHISTALENLYEFADEIVVLDTGSTDDTKCLAAEHGAVVRDFVWCDDFAKARNVSLVYCTKQFVMWLDADDRIPREDALRLRELLQGEPDWDLLHLPYLYSQSIRKLPPRIFRNGMGIHGIHAIHDCFGSLENLAHTSRHKRR